MDYHAGYDARSTLSNIPDTVGKEPWEHLAEAEEAEEDTGTLDLAEIGQVPAEALSAFLRFLIPSGSICSGRTRWQTAALRVAVLAHALLPEVREISETDLAEELGVSRSAVSKAVTALRDFASLDCRAGRTETGREVYRQRARACWNRKKETHPPERNLFPPPSRAGDAPLGENS